MIASDNDTAGLKFKEQLKEVFKNKKKLYEFEFPQGKKDVNDMTKEEIYNLEEKEYKN